MSPHLTNKQTRVARHLVVLLAASALLAGCGQGIMTSRYAAKAPIQTAASAGKNAPRYSNRVVVRYKAGASASAVRSFHQRFGLSTVRDMSSLNMGVLALPTSLSSETAIPKLQGNAAIDFVEPDFMFTLPKAPAKRVAAASRTTAPVTSATRAFHLQGVGLAQPEDLLEEEWGMAKIGMPTVWRTNGGSNRVTVAIVDTGIDLNHPDLAPALVPGTSVLAASSGPNDDHGHGTHVAGVIAGQVADGKGISGIAPNCKIMPVKVLNTEGKGDTGDIVTGILWAVNNGAKVINMSLGGAGGSRALMAAIQYAQSKDVVLVAAMGNEGSNIQEYPAGYPGVIAVGATDRNDQLGDFSNFGSWISVAAPGVDIVSSLPRSSSAYVVREEFKSPGYDSMDGTSMAAPFVTGLAALIRSQEPNLTAAQVKSRIEKSADDLGDPGFDEQFGWGRINAIKALASR